VFTLIIVTSPRCQGKIYQRAFGGQSLKFGKGQLMDDGSIFGCNGVEKKTNITGVFPIVINWFYKFYINQ